MPHWLCWPRPATGQCEMLCPSWTRPSPQRPLKTAAPYSRRTQIRELMGTVPNAVFERLLEAVAAGQSAELMEQLNLLVNAGHNPSSLARQMVRYLRNTLMAKLGGEQTELLQISGDERARAARTALLFTEEELTRNLQIVLRTFDDLNYRQEQRFHLELGLIKLIHAQRLLPIEELLSGALRRRVSSAAPLRLPHPAHQQALRGQSQPLPHRPHRLPSLPLVRPAAEGVRQPSRSNKAPARSLNWNALRPQSPAKPAHISRQPLHSPPQPAPSATPPPQR